MQYLEQFITDFYCDTLLSGTSNVSKYTNTHEMLKQDREHDELLMKLFFFMNIIYSCVIERIFFSSVVCVLIQFALHRDQVALIRGYSF